MESVNLGDEIEVKNPYHGSAVRGPRALLEVLEHFRRPRSLETIRREKVLDPEILELLRRNFILLREDEIDLLAEGLVWRRPPPIGAEVSIMELRLGEHRGGDVVVGAPSDLGAVAEPGARFGPREIRRAFDLPLDTSVPGRELVDLELDLRWRRGPSVRDLGDVRLEVGESLSLFGKRLGRALEEILAADARPLVLGGDHSITAYCLETFLEHYGRLGVVHFDAHHDLYARASGRLSHANPFLRALDDPRLERLLQIGLRTVEWMPTAPDERIRRWGALAARRAPPEEVLADFPPDLPCYLSFDIDCLEPALAPETGTPMPGGLDYYTALLLVDVIASRLRVVGADFVEVGAGGVPNSAARITARLLARLMLAHAD